MLDKPHWQMTAVLTEKRELKTKKDEVWAYSFKLMALGGMFNVTTKDAAFYHQLAEGETLVFTGTFEQYNGGVQLVLTDTKSFELPTTKKSA